MLIALHDTKNAIAFFVSCVTRIHPVTTRKPQSSPPKRGTVLYLPKTDQPLKFIESLGLFSPEDFTVEGTESSGRSGSEEPSGSKRRMSKIL